MREEELVYMYRLPPDGYKNIYKIDRALSKTTGSSLHIVHVTDDLNEVFNFVNLDRIRYEDGFSTMFEYSSWVLENCSYLTRAVINSLNHGAESDSVKLDEELRDDLRKFVGYVTLSHEEIRDNEIFPAMLYYNIKEEIIRNFFYSDELEDQFKKLKKKELFKNEVLDKFNSGKMVVWIPALKDNPELINKFGRSFINYMTDEKVERFPDYLVDSENAEIRRDAILFYENEFTQST
jgi:hypothetical protein